jgi:hypothetical protein
MHFRGVMRRSCLPCSFGFANLIYKNYWAISFTRAIKIGAEDKHRELSRLAVRVVQSFVAHRGHATTRDLQCYHEDCLVTLNRRMWRVLGGHES